MLFKTPNLKIDNYRTKPLSGGDIRRIAQVVIGLRTYFIETEHWSETLNKGSYTLKNHVGSPQHIILFVDSNGQFAAHNHLSMDDAFVVGVDLSSLEPIARNAMRDWLKKEFRFYIDPRDSNNSLWQFQPVKDTKPVYDVLFLEKGRCPYELDERLIHELALLIEENFATSQDGKAVVIRQHQLPHNTELSAEVNAKIPRSISITRNFGTWAMSRNYSATVHEDGRVELRNAHDFRGRMHTQPELVPPEKLQPLFRELDRSRLFNQPDQDFHNPSSVLDAGSVDVSVKVGEAEKHWKSGIADYWNGKENLFNPIIELFEQALAEARS